MGKVTMRLLCLLCLVVLAESLFKYDAVLDFTPGNDNISGQLKFFRGYYGITISGKIYGLSPGYHGFHVHTKDDLGNKCANAEGHFNPFGSKHGGLLDRERHVGDLGNIFANYKGIAFIYIIDNRISLDRNSKAYIGDRSIVVHQGVDDLGRGGDEGSMTTGNAGGRAGCGLIRHLDHGRY